MELFCGLTCLKNLRARREVVFPVWFSLTPSLNVTLARYPMYLPNSCPSGKKKVEQPEIFLKGLKLGDDFVRQGTVETPVTKGSSSRIGWIKHSYNTMTIASSWMTNNLSWSWLQWGFISQATGVSSSGSGHKSSWTSYESINRSLTD